MKIVYICHPISGDVQGNLKKISEIYATISLIFPDVIPFAPYYATLMSLDDSNPMDRNLGILHNMEFFKRGIIDEVWLFGDRVTNGMHQEINAAETFGIPVVNKTTPMFP